MQLKEKIESFIFQLHTGIDILNKTEPNYIKRKQ